MLAALFLLLWFDDAAQVWTRPWMLQHFGVGGGVGGIGILMLLAIVLPLATREVAVLFTAERIRPYRFISIVGSTLLTLHAFLTQFPPFQPIAASSLAFIIVFIMLFAALRRAWIRQTQDAILKMAGTVLATLYIGGLTWFLMAIRVKHSSGASRIPWDDLDGPGDSADGEVDRHLRLLWRAHVRSHQAHSLAQPGKNMGRPRNWIVCGGSGWGNLLGEWEMAAARVGDQGICIRRCHWRGRAIGGPA